MTYSHNKENNDTSSSRPWITRYEGETYDRTLHAGLSKIWGLFSPASLFLAHSDWLMHFLKAPAKQAEIAKMAYEKWIRLVYYYHQCQTSKDPEICIKLRSGDDRFKDKCWKELPYNLYSQSFLLLESIWDEATRNIRGVSEHHSHVINFVTRQCLDMFSPSNFPWTNPEVIAKIIEKKGSNFIKGTQNLMEDVMRYASKLPPVGLEKFRPGKEVAVTPGKVIYRNRLCELIQYEPKTKNVSKEPILITPAWIMKYYILDLSPHNSLVKFLVKQGHTVFMISWKNPDKEDSNLGLDDYLKLGIMDSIKTINEIIPRQKINAVGYCIGGTLLMLAAAALAGKGEHLLNTLTLFATEVDFRTPGELQLFIDESQVTYLEDIMWERGYLKGSQMSSTFSWLRSSDLIWSRIIKEYMMGERQEMFDLMAWDLDTTRLPYKMHSEYLRKLFLHNELILGQFTVEGRHVALLDINAPIFSVGTQTDHIAPWGSVYKIHLYTQSNVTFILTSGGHNAGIVSEPGHEGRHFQMMTTRKRDKRLNQRDWVRKARRYDGSWWPEWHKWLLEHSSGKIKARTPGDPKKGLSPICDAPGTYVFQK